jgi:hypothetical protein
MVFRSEQASVRRLSVAVVAAIFERKEGIPTFSQILLLHSYRHSRKLAGTKLREVGLQETLVATNKA